jgi:hypothetical protein
MRKITKLYDDDQPSESGDEDSYLWRRNHPLTDTEIGLLLLGVLMISVPWVLGIVWIVEKVAP